MATPDTITIGSTTTAPVPTEVKIYSDSPYTLHVPIDGAAIVQVSAYGSSLGDKNAQKFLIWDAIPTSDSRWTHTVPTLKALEGSQTTLNMGSKFGNAYSIDTGITVHQVKVEWLGKGRSYDIWRVELLFSDT